MRDGARASACARWRATPAAIPATRTRAAPSAAPKRIDADGGIAGLKRGPGSRPSAGGIVSAPGRRRCSGSRSARPRMVLALCVVVHLRDVIYAVRGGLTRAEILGRTRGSWGRVLRGFVVAGRECTRRSGCARRARSRAGGARRRRRARAVGLALLGCARAVVCGGRAMMARQRRGAARPMHPGYWAFVAHRVSGLALTVFLPLHFWVLGLSLRGRSRARPIPPLHRPAGVHAGEWGLVVLLAVHAMGGVRRAAHRICAVGSREPDHVGSRMRRRGGPRVRACADRIAERVFAGAAGCARCGASSRSRAGWRDP